MSKNVKLPAIDPATVEPVIGSNYPAPFRPGVAGRAKQRLGDALGLKNFGVNRTTIKPAGRTFCHKDGSAY
jgi:uncharacterized cupin superfamily protein